MRRHRHRRPLVAAVVAAFTVTLGLPGSLHASPLFELAGAVQGDGGFAARAVEAGAASAYFNPAFLADAVASLDVGVFTLVEEIGVRLQGRTRISADIPVESVDMERPGGGRYDHYGLPTVWLNSGRAASPPDVPLAARPRQSAGSGHGVHTYQAVGLVGRLLDGRVGVGLHAMIPYSGFTSAAAFYSDEREQYFSNSLHPELYGDRLTTTSLAFGLGARVHPRLAVGAGTSLGLHTRATTPTYVADLGHFDNLAIDSNVAVKTNLAPHLGLAYFPTSTTVLTATAHSPQKVQIDTQFSFLLANGIEQRATVHFTHAFLPWRFALGASQRLLALPDGGLFLTATVLHARWSSYLDRHGERPHPAYGWYDTTSGTVGLRWRKGRGRALLDVAYQPSPVPAQTGRTNYVDNNRASAVAGVGYRVPLRHASLGVDLQLQGHRLLSRTADKTGPGAVAGIVDEVPDDAVIAGNPVPGRGGLQTNNPGWPGFSSAGWVLGAAVSVNLTY
jgi:long-chain fatty acid transport protein